MSLLERCWLLIPKVVPTDQIVDVICGYLWKALNKMHSYLTYYFFPILLLCVCQGVLSGWISSTNNCDLSLCTPVTKQIWNVDVVYNKSHACEALVSSNIRRIYFMGDSYMRHISLALHATLHANISLYVDSKLTLTFVEKYCQSKVIADTNVLDRHPVPGINSIIHKAKSQNLSSPMSNSVVLFCYGNHGLGRTSFEHRTCRNPSVCRYCKTLSSTNQTLERTVMVCCV